MFYLLRRGVSYNKYQGTTLVTNHVLIIQSSRLSTTWEDEALGRSYILMPRGLLQKSGFTILRFSSGPIRNLPEDTFSACSSMGLQSLEDHQANHKDIIYEFLSGVAWRMVFFLTVESLLSLIC